MEDNFSTKVGEGWFGNDSIHCIYCAFYFSYYYIVMYNEIITQLTTMQNQIIRHYISSLGSLTCPVHSRVCVPPRILCHHRSDRRQSSGGNVNDGGWL